jgi:hypothetical protein
MLANDGRLDLLFGELRSFRASPGDFFLLPLKT